MLGHPEAALPGSCQAISTQIGETTTTVYFDVNLSMKDQTARLVRSAIQVMIARAATQFGSRVKSADHKLSPRL